jgi:hypothetical protein
MTTKGRSTGACRAAGAGSARPRLIHVIGPRLAVLGCALAAAAGINAAPAAARRVYRSPGYHWNHKLPKVAPVIPGKLISLGDGADPHLIVDAAGTGQIAYNADTSGGFGPSVLHDCVLLRGQTGCAANSGLVPPEAGDPTYNIDDDGPTPLAIGNQLLMLDHRYPNPETLPDGSSGYPTFLWTSEDGGKTFTGPGTIGNLAVSGNAIIFGGNQPQIGVITDTMTGGTIFQSTPPGAYTSNRLNLGDQGPDEAYDGRLALDGNTPVAEFQDLNDHIYIREYNGTGDIDSSSSWSVAEIDGQGYSRLVGGPSGVWLLYQKTYSGPLFVQRIVHGSPSGAAAQVTPNSNFSHANYAITEDATGRLTVGWFTDGPNDLYVASSTDGRRWGAPQIIARNLNAPSNLVIGAAGDGGGFAAFQEPEPGGPSGSQIDVAAFGSFAATGLKGLGNLDGDGIGGLGGDPLGSVSCTDVHFGDIDAIAEAGCFLRDPRNPSGGAAIIQGEIRLNGLEIIPDAGVEIVIDPRQHTINTTGSVRVVLRAPGIGDITLFHGALNVSLSGSLADTGQTLFDLDTATASSLEGFPFATSIDVQIQHDAVVIPVSLKLPPYMGSVTGAATLRADNTSGLQLSSLHIGVPDLVLGALEVKDLNIDYTQMGNVWTGSAMLNIPAGTPYFGIAVAVRFDNGDFTMGSFDVSVPFPGVPIFTDTYLDGFGGGFDIHPDRRSFHGSVMVGAIPLDPPNYTIGVTGTVTITFINGGPVVLEVDGSGSVHGLSIATAKLLFQTNGYFEVDGNLDVDLGVAELQASLSAFADLPAEEFSAQINGSLSIVDYPAIGIQGVVSSKGVAACGSYLGAAFGLYYAWGDTPSAGFGCDVSPYVVKPVSAASIARRAGGRARVAAVAMAAGAPFEDLAVTGAGAPPSVVLHSPSGQTVIPVRLGPGASAGDPAVALPDARNNITYVMIRHAGGGTWTVSAAPGSAPITSVAQARGYAPVKVHARVSGRGATRRLTYSLTTHPGLSVSFAERAHREYRVLGTARGKHGTLRFVPGAGVAGKRTIYALVSENGVPRQTLAVGSYIAPGPVTPSRVRGLRVRRHGRRFSVSFAGATGAAYYRVQVVGSDGRRLLDLVRGHRHTLTLPVIGYHDRLSVTVTGMSVLGRKGRAVSARAQ